MILQDTDNAEKVHCCVTPPPRPPRFCLRPIRPEREPPEVPWGRSIIYQKFTKNIRDAEKWWCIFSFARDCLLQYVPPTLESNIRREKKKTFLVMINVLHFRVHDNKTFMQNHYKAQRLIPQPASLARLASGYIYALLSGKRSSSFGWSRQMEGFIPYSKHFFFSSFLLLNQMHKSLFFLFPQQSASILKLRLTPLKFSFQTLFSLSLSLSFYGMVSSIGNPTQLFPLSWTLGMCVAAVKHAVDFLPRQINSRSEVM